MIKNLDHVNIRTSHLREMTEFYVRVLKLDPGRRPPFGFGWMWLYCGDTVIVHLVGTSEKLENKNPQIEHFAIKGLDFRQTMDHLTREGIACRVSPVPDRAMTQIHLNDMDGNHIEINFDEEHRP